MLKRSQEELEQLVHYDPLTGLPNRFNLPVQLKLAIEAALKSNTTEALICVCVDRFKNIKEYSGHTISDELLKSVADRLANCMRQDDVVGRLSGDEFAIMIHNIVHLKIANRVVEKIQPAFGQRFRLGDNHFDFSASIRVSLFPTDGNTVEALFKNTDIVVRNAKDRISAA
ncbi:MAG: diguanylate cyclase domain-containing protein [Gammaproteobacteria bacterium]